MFVGHALLAFALVAGVAHALDRPRERALALGALAAAFATAPDVDMLYAPVGVVGADTVTGAATGFWSAGNVVHRAVTHSLPVGGVLAGALAALARGGRYRYPAGAALAGLVAVAAAESGALGAVVMAAFVLVALAVAAGGVLLGFSPRAVGAAALVGLLSHPFGDLLTGEPPAMLYPLDAALVASRPDPFADPTLNLLAPFALELAVAWLAALTYLWVDGARLRETLAGRATVGAGYAGAALVLPAPTLETSYHFVFSVLAVGAVAAVPTRLRRYPRRTLVTGLAAVTLAGAAYTAVYLGL